jgi:hypothetical protein
MSIYSSCSCAADLSSSITAAGASHTASFDSTERVHLRSGRSPLVRESCRQSGSAAGQVAGNPGSSVARQPQQRVGRVGAPSPSECVSGVIGNLGAHIFMCASSRTIFSLYPAGREQSSSPTSVRRSRGHSARSCLWSGALDPGHVGSGLR